MIKIATWNVNSLRVRLPHVINWLEVNQPDMLALQETKVEDQNFPVEVLKAAGYQAVYAGQKTYNGVAILSREAATDVDVENPFFADPQRRIIAATINGIRLINLYVPNGESVGSAKYEYKLLWIEKMAEYLQQQLQRYSKLAVVGDFNIAPDDRDVHDPEQWQGSVLCSEPERLGLQDWLKLGLTDAFRLFEQETGHFSWWDYRAAAFRRNLGLRIDHILISQALIPACSSCIIDKTPRKLERPSDHTPVLLQLSL